MTGTKQGGTINIMMRTLTPGHSVISRYSLHRPSNYKFMDFSLTVPSFSTWERKEKYYTRFERSYLRNKS